MPFIDIRLAGTATREQKAQIVGDVTRSMVERLGKPAAAVQVNITELTQSYPASGDGVVLRLNGTEKPRIEGFLREPRVP